MTGSPDPVLPVVTADARFVPFHEVRGRPHVVVDGPAGDGTVLGLSHWPDGATPPRLAADTSAQIVARYLDAAPAGAPVDIVTNNHFDEDGLLAAFLLLRRPDATVRQLALAAADAGDFQTWTEPAAARCAIALMAMAERPTTPFADVLRALNRAGSHDPAGAITIALLPHVESLLRDPDRHRRLWEPMWRAVKDDMALLEDGRATIDEVPGIDLAVVRAPRPLSAYAIHPRISAMRVLTATPDGMLSMHHRYETWVRYVSRPLPPRRELSPFADRLTALETRSGVWRFEGVEHPQARLRLVDDAGRPAPSGLSAERLIHELVEIESSADR